MSETPVEAWMVMAGTAYVESPPTDGDEWNSGIAARRIAKHIAKAYAERDRPAPPTDPFDTANNCCGCGTILPATYLLCATCAAGRRGA